MERWSRQSTLRIVLLYALFGMLWITASDRLLELLVADPHRITVIQTYKGWGFVFASAVVIYFAARRELQARERAERKVKESEEKYRALIENANDAILVFDADAGLVIEANKRAVALLGLPSKSSWGCTTRSSIRPKIRSNAAVFLMMPCARARSLRTRCAFFT
jgi:PAS domain-containing protein